MRSHETLSCARQPHSWLPEQRTKMITMKKDTAKSRITFTESTSTTPMTADEWEACEDMLARMIARAIAAEHPEVFRPELTKEDQNHDSEMEENC